MSLWWDKSSVPRCLPLPFYFLLLIIWLHSIVVCLLYRKVQFLILLLFYFIQSNYLSLPFFYCFTQRISFFLNLSSFLFFSFPLFPPFLFFRSSFSSFPLFSVPLFSLRHFPYRWYYEWCSYTVQIVRSQHVGNWRSKRILASNILPFQESREVSNNI